MPQCNFPPKNCYINVNIEEHFSVPGSSGDRDRFNWAAEKVLQLIQRGHFVGTVAHRHLARTAAHRYFSDILQQRGQSLEIRRQNYSWFSLLNTFYLCPYQQDNKLRKVLCIRY